MNSTAQKNTDLPEILRNVALFTGAKFVHRLSPLRKFGRAGILRVPFTEPISKNTLCNIINLKDY